MRVIRRISAVILGFVFFIAGIFKLMDPVGAGLVVEEYFKFFHMRFLLPAAGFLGSADALFETVLGAALITGVWRKPTAIITSALTAAFTVLTIILYIANPSMDCGCFGEAAHLTHLQSLLKNIVLLGLCALAFIPLRSQEPTRKIKYVSFSIATVSVSLFFLYSVLSIPLVDFTPFKPGEELMLPDDIDLPADAALLPFCDAQDEYVDSLATGGRVIIISIYDVDKVSARHWEKIEALAGIAEQTGCTPLILTASTPDTVSSLGIPSGIMPCIYFADRRTLLTLNRSNSGATFIYDGQIITKWSINKYPDRKRLDTLSNTSPTESLVSENNGSRLKLQGFLLYVFAVMLLL